MINMERENINTQTDENSAAERMKLINYEYNSSVSNI